MKMRDRRMSKSLRGGLEGSLRRLEKASVSGMLDPKTNPQRLACRKRSRGCCEGGNDCYREIEVRMIYSRPMEEKTLGEGRERLSRVRAERREETQESDLSRERALTRATRGRWPDDASTPCSVQPSLIGHCLSPLCQGQIRTPFVLYVSDYECS